MPNSHNSVIKKILSVIKNNQKFFIAGHVRPDGDCVSAQLALALFLRRIGKKVLVVNRDAIPLVYNFLPGIKQIKSLEKTNEKFEVGFFLDTSGFARTGDIIDLNNQLKIVVNIDHHIDAVEFGDYNYIDPEASSTSEQIYMLLKDSPYSISRDEALCLYTGIMTDTGGFQQLNTTWRTHNVVADLLRKGVNLYYVSQKLYRNKTISELKLLSLVLSTLQIDSSGQIAFSELTNKMYQKAHSSPQETERIVDYLQTLGGVKIVILFKETDPRNSIKVSLRSNDKIDVNKIAKIFGGGGHKKAAGCTVTGSMLQVQQKVFKEAKKGLKNYGRSS